MAHAYKSADFLFFPSPVAPSLRVISRGKNIKKNTVLDMIRHLLAILCIKLNFFSSPYSCPCPRTCRMACCCCCQSWIILCNNFYTHKQKRPKFFFTLPLCLKTTVTYLPTVWLKRRKMVNFSTPPTKVETNCSEWSQLSNPKNSHLETRPKLLLFTICKCIVLCILVDIEPIKQKIIEKINHFDYHEYHLR